MEGSLLYFGKLQKLIILKKTLVLNLFIITSFGDYKTSVEGKTPEEIKHKRNWEPIFFRSENYTSD